MRRGLPHRPWCPPCVKRQPLLAGYDPGNHGSPIETKEEYEYREGALIIDLHQSSTGIVALPRHLFRHALGDGSKSQRPADCRRWQNPERRQCVKETAMHLTRTLLANALLATSLALGACSSADIRLRS